MLITLRAPTKDMKNEALTAGPCAIPGYTEGCPRLQIITVAGLLAGNQPRYPAPVTVEAVSPGPAPTQEPIGEAYQRALPRTLVPIGKKPRSPVATTPVTASPRKRAAGD